MKFEFRFLGFKSHNVCELVCLIIFYLFIYECKLWSVKKTLQFDSLAKNSAQFWSFENSFSLLNSPSNPLYLSLFIFCRVLLIIQAPSNMRFSNLFFSLSIFHYTFKFPCFSFYCSFFLFHAKWLSKYLMPLIFVILN